MKKFIKCLSVFLFFLSIIVMGLTAYGDQALPDTASTVSGKIDLGRIFTAEYADRTVKTFSETHQGEEVSYDVKLLNIFPVKSMNVQVERRKYLAVGGELVGIRVRTQGVLVVGTDAFDSENGKISPADRAGIKKGDILLELEGTPIQNNDDLIGIIENSGGRTLRARIDRSGEIIYCDLTPEKSAATGMYKGGLWIRDSTAGVGTLTYCDPELGELAALGHGIYDADTGDILSISEGEIYSASFSYVKKGSAGTPGEISGIIGNNTLGSVTGNTEEGIFGNLYYMNTEPVLYPVGTASEVHTGPAQIICTVSDQGKDAFDIEISRINDKDGDTKNMIIKVTDTDLLSITGGIVQGMSGSPIIQDGQLIGAVTHVFVNDPKSGYGIFIENMLDESR